MKNKKRAPKLIWRIFLGFFCFLLLTFLLYATQFLATCYMRYDNAMSELSQIRDVLASQVQLDELSQTMDEIYKQDLQKASLLLSNEELSNEKLASVMENLVFASEMIIFREDDTLLYAYGDVPDSAAFLSRLRKNGSVKAANGFSYRAIPFENDLYLAISTNFDLTEEIYGQEPYELEIIKELASGMANDILVASQKDDRLIYGPEELIGRSLADFLVTPLESDTSLHIMLDGNSINLLISQEYEDYLLMSSFDSYSLFQDLQATVTPALLGFGFLILLLLAYTEFIRTDMGIGRLGKIHYVQFGKKRYINTVLLRKLSGFALIGITCMICITYCLQLLIRSEAQRHDDEYRLDIAARMLEESQSDLAKTEKLDMEILVDTAKEIKSILAANPKLFSEDGLKSLSRVFEVNDIYILNEDGKTDITSANQQTMMISSYADDETYPFWNVINGFVESHVQLVHNDPYNQDRDMMYAGIADLDNRGMVLITLTYDTFKTWMQSYDPDTVLRTVGLGSASSLLAVKAGSTTCVFDSSNQYTGLSLDAYGIDEALLRNGYSGTHQFDDEDCLITTRTVLDWNLIYITPTFFITLSSWFFTALSVITGLLVVVIAVLPWIVVRTPGEDLRTPVDKKHLVSHRSHVDAILTRDGQIELEENQVEQHTMSRRWMKMNANAKLNYLIRIFLLVISCYLLFSLLFGSYSGRHPLIELIMAKNWDKSLNVYALSYVAIVLAGIWFVAKILQSITLFVTGTFSRRWKTLGILISNIIRYTALIASIFFTLQNFGVETSALITSASVLTLVFGLGCQSFVADMVAGVFLIFEGTFRVGDIVTVDGWRGEVVEIGLRSTNVKNELGNVKVFQNSRISGAINMTRDLTCAVCDIILPPGEPLEAYEEKLTASFFPMAMQSIRSIRQPLVYEGVVAMNGDSATLRISVKCLESEREQIRRDLYRTLKLWREQDK